jgi:hypothetical protein
MQLSPKPQLLASPQLRLVEFEHLPADTPSQVRVPPQSESVSHVDAEQAPSNAPLQVYPVPRLVQSEFAQQLVAGPPQLPAVSPLQVRVPPHSASVLQPDLAGQLPSMAPEQVVFEPYADVQSLVYQQLVAGTPQVPRASP